MTLRYVNIPLLLINSDILIHATVLLFALLFSRERDTTGQLIGDIDQVISVLVDLVNGNATWAEACNRLPAYDGVQAVD
jgi:hypothetical protein